MRTWWAKERRGNDQFLHLRPNAESNPHTLNSYHAIMDEWWGFSLDDFRRTGRVRHNKKV